MMEIRMGLAYHRKMQLVAVVGTMTGWTEVTVAVMQAM